MAMPIEIHIGESTRERFLLRQVQIVRRGNWECWLWRGAYDGRGYGGFGASDRTYKAHRISHYIFIGPIPSGLVIDHLCRTRGCVNPDHLEVVTSGENTRRGARRGVLHRDQRTHCKEGHPLLGDNTYVNQGRQYCRQCFRKWRMAYY